MEHVNHFYNILTEVCKEEGIKEEKLSFDWITKLTKGDKVHFAVRNQFDINSSTSTLIAGDKYATYSVLRNNEIPICEHQIVFNPKLREDYYDENFIIGIKMLLSEHGAIVIKGNNSYGGREVFKETSLDGAIDIITKLFNENNVSSVSVCPYMDLNKEYRCIYLDGEVLLLYEKSKPVILGNGKNTLKELMDFYIEEHEEEHDESVDDIYVEVPLEYIPKDGEEINIGWKFNLEQGGTPRILNIDENKEIVDLAIKAAKAIGINFASVDVAEEKNGNLSIMEINGSVCMTKFSCIAPNGFNITKEIYRKVLHKIF